MKPYNITVIIPSLNPDEKLANTVSALIEMGFHDIILVNDGSRADCLPFFPVDSSCCTLLSHPVNLGKGAALKTAFRYYLASGRETGGVITVDGDGQHCPEDVRRCAEAMLERGRVVLGVRNFRQPQIPARSRLGNTLTSFVFRVLLGLRISDTQTGLRAIPAACLPMMLQVDGSRYEYETNMLLQMKAAEIPFDEIEIETVYLENNQTSHFRPIRDSIRIYGLILKFLSSSMLSAVLDLGAFYILSWFLAGVCGIFTDALCTVAARVLSSVFNYFLNRRSVFRSTAPVKSSLIRYYILAVGILLLSSLSITLLTLLFHMTDGSFALIKTGCKFIVDSLLFMISFRVQREWVFSGKYNHKG